MEDKGEISDGYHTFNELYEHRHLLFRALCKSYSSTAWKSKLHDDGSCFEDWFVAGIVTPSGKDVTYHIPMRLWDDFSGNTILEKAPKFDGHTAQDVLQRLKEF